MSNSVFHYENMLKLVELTNQMHHEVHTEKGLRKIPPLNTILFQTAREPHIISGMFAGVDDEVEPKNFDWREKSKGKLDVSQDQKLCGCCWSIAMASAFSDVIAIAHDFTITPHLSNTYILSCYGQLQCKGGIVSEGIKDLTKYGIVDETCIDYSWCLRNEKCAGDPTKHFQADPEYINSRIPTCIGCRRPDKFIRGEQQHPNEYKNSKLEKCDIHHVEDFENNKVLRCNIAKKGDKVWKYFSKEPVNQFAKPNFEHFKQNQADFGKVLKLDSETELIDNIHHIKDHIMIHGPAIGSFFVLNNFLDAIDNKFSQTNGIYIDSYAYPGKHGITKQDGKYDFKTEYRGGHAIVIVGWGVDHVEFLGKDVEYWICRNSWGTEWGDGGYWKHAMYPHEHYGGNRVSQFDVGFPVIDGKTGRIKKDDEGKDIYACGIATIEYDYVQSKIVTVDEDFDLKTDQHDDKEYKTTNVYIEPKTLEDRRKGAIEAIEKKALEECPEQTCPEQTCPVQEVCEVCPPEKVCPKPPKITIPQIVQIVLLSLLLIINLIILITMF